MTEITSKIESIRNMKEDLHSIKMISQRNTDKMLQDLADFRNRICHEMSEIESTYRSGRIHKRKDKRKSNRINQENSDSDYDGSQTNSDSKQMNFILKEIKNVQERSKELFVELENSTEAVTDVSTSLSNMHIGSPNKENCLSSTDTLASIPTPDEVNILFSKQLPYRTSDSREVNHKLKNKSITDGIKIENFNDSFDKQKIDKLTKKLKDIQTQNNELRTVNENIQNLLVKLSDLKYADADDDTMDNPQAVKKESQTSDATYLPQIGSETVPQAENYQKFIRSIQLTNDNPRKMLTKIKVAKLIIKRLRSCGNVADQERKYKVRVRQADQNIKFKAHHNKPQSVRLLNLK